MSVNVHYVGFTAKAMVREYSFLARESSIDSHEITFTILNEAFASHRLSPQNLLAQTPSRIGRFR